MDEKNVVHRDEEGTKIEVKPVLKKQSLIGKKSGARKKKALKWDEHAIVEHDQLRGTRMRIDEPNTPYNYDSYESDDSARHKSPSDGTGKPNPQGLNWDALESKLAEAAAACPSSPSASSDDAEKKRRFQIHRKEHYNEMEAVRNFRLKCGDSMDEDDDADDEKEDAMKALSMAPMDEAS